METAERIAAFLEHPAPGLVFGPHDAAKVGRRAYHTPHFGGEAPSTEELRILHELTSKHAGAHRGLLDFYTRINGAAFCVLWQDFNTRDVPALMFLPIADWEDATAEWSEGGEMASFMEGCEMFAKGAWRVIAALPSESQSLVYFFDGEHESSPLAGKMFCVGLDGILGFEEVLAESFDDFARQFTENPAGVFDRIGFTWHVGRGDSMWGDPVEAYVPDVRLHPDLTEWKR